MYVKVNKIMNVGDNKLIYQLSYIDMDHKQQILHFDNYAKAIKYKKVIEDWFNYGI